MRAGDVAGCCLPQPTLAENAMHDTLHTVILIAAAALLSACQSAPPAAPAHIANGADLVKAADWGRMRTVTVTMDEHNYEPRELRLQAGQPYKIELKNQGEKDHYFTAPEFFKSVAWRKLMVNKQAEIKVDYVTATEVLKKGGQLDLYVIPVRAGRYPVYCTIDDHRDKGMDGGVIVE